MLQIVTYICNSNTLENRWLPLSFLTIFNTVFILSNWNQLIFDLQFMCFHFFHAPNQSNTKIMSIYVKILNGICSDSNHLVWVIAKIAVNFDVLASSAKCVSIDYKQRTFIKSIHTVYIAEGVASNIRQFTSILTAAN